jgi:adenylate cyclase
MRYRTKILTTLIAVALLTNGVSLGYLYCKAKEYLFEQIRTTVHSIATTAAANLDGGALESLCAEDQGSAAFLRLEQELRRLRDVNRRQDVFVKFIYTIHVLPDNPDERFFGLDPEEDPREKSLYGDPYDGSENQNGVFDLPLRLDVSAVDNHFTRDRWGEWITAKAPIRDRAGRVVAALGVDVAADDVRGKLDVMYYTACVSIGLSVALAAGASLSLARRVTQPLDRIRDAVQRIGTGDLENMIDLRSRDEFGEVASAINAMTSGLREKGVIQKLFARYVSADVAARIIADSEVHPVKGVRRRITILFSDIRGFTQFSELLPPEEVLSHLDEYFECMIPVIQRNQGTLDKFLGDGLMVHFGAVNDDPCHEEHAVNAALEMQAALRELGDRWLSRGRKQIAIGIGIHSGIAVVGNVGSAQRMEYTAIGDTVNLAARLEPLTKEFGVPLVISEDTCRAVQHRFRTQFLGECDIRGRQGKIRLHTVRDLPAACHPPVASLVAGADQPAAISSGPSMLANA